MEQLVLPVLSDFQPDLIINAAGQDNHYTDPLTNMNVTAQGYARLTELLQPDIVVLEGGYSIEGALPYVNVGIILAFTGLDYTMVRKPGSGPSEAPQTVKEIVRRTVGYLQETWENRHKADLDKIFGPGPFFARRSRIYYDTDEIMEEQQEEIKRYDACSGYRVVISAAAKMYRPGRRIAAVLTPWHACQRCRAEALEAYEKLQPGRDLEYVYFQDVMEDRYLVKSLA